MRKKNLLLIFCLLLGFTAYAQQRVSGIVTDVTNEPIPGLTILEKGTGNGVITDIDGNYTINVSGSNSILVFSFIGMQTQEIEVGNRPVINVVMSDDFTDLDELVVIGYGVQRRALVTGANVNVGGDQIAEMRTSTAMEALQGVTPGVQITRNHGAPGAGTKVTIRGLGTVGTADPLYIVDGVAVSNINYLNSSDIESIDVLKDAASAAIYGSRAANGVILVTTKKGKAGAKPTISYDGYFGIQNIYKKPSVLNAQEYMYIFDEARLNDGAEPYNWESMIKTNPYLNNNFPGSLGTEYGNYVWDKLQSGWTGTDWVKEITMKDAPMQSHSVNISGGAQDVTYALGVSYLDQTGIIGGHITDAGYKRLTTRMNTEMVLVKNSKHSILTIGENFTYNNTQNRSVANGDIYYNDLHSAIVGNPLVPLYYDKHELNAMTSGYGPTLEGVHRNMHNPVARLFYRHNFNWSKGNTVVGNVYGILEPVQNLKYRSSFGINGWFGHSRSYSPVYGLADTDKRTVDGVNQSKYQGVNYTWTNTLTYDWRTNEHSFNFLVGSEMVKNVLNSSMSAFKAKTAFGLPENAYLDNVQVVESVGDISASGRDWAAQGGGLMSYMARVSYNLSEKYMFDVTLRADGSSNFAKNNRWGYFPSMSAGWNFTEEEFMPDVDWLTFGKLRASWGQNGNQSIPNFIYLSNIEYLTRGYYFGNDKVVSAPTAVPANIPNSDVKWETSEQLNFGLDARLFNSRMGVNFDWYRKITKDWLVVAPVLGTSGAAAPYINGGDVENKGFELMLSWNDRVGDFNYGVTLSGAYNQNKITRLDNAEGVITGSVNALAQNTSYVSRASVGKPIGYFYGYKTDGIFQNQSEVDAYVTADGKPIMVGSEDGVLRRPGDVRFVDQNGDGVIDDADKVMLGSPLPDYEMGLQLNAEYKGVYMNTTLVSKLGMQVMQSYRDFAGMPMENFPSSVLNRWHGEGTSNRLPRVTAVTNANYSNISDIYMHDADYVRISNLTVGYRFNEMLRSVNWMQAASVYVSFSNLYTFTKYDGMDPEVGYSPDSWASGIDLGLYPLPRTVMFGVNLTF
jgi:TonB-linked SusC/RagA family outer membrane protein